MKNDEHPSGAMHPALRSTLTGRIPPPHLSSLPLHKSSSPTISRNPSTAPEETLSSGNYNLPVGYTPFLETVRDDMKTNEITPMRLPSHLTTEDFTRAVAVATVSALRHQGSIGSTASHKRLAGHGGTPASQLQHQQQVVKETKEDHEDEGEGGGHEGPSWTRGMSAGVLLSCTLLYAIIAGK